MRLNSEFLFNGPREKVWDILQDPDVLILAVPGTNKLNKLNEGEYEGEMNVKVGPLNGVFQGHVVLSDRVAPESYNIIVDAKGPLGFGKGSGKVQLVDKGDGNTLMKYDIDLQIGGKLASVGQRLLETVTQSMSRESLESLNKVLKARLSGKSADAIVPPSQSAFAMRVGMNLMGRMFCSPITWIVIALIVSAAIWWSMTYRK